MSKPKSAKDILERMKTVAARRSTPAPKEPEIPPEKTAPEEVPPPRRKVRITVDLDPEMHRFLKVYAAERGMKVSEVVRGLIEGLKGGGS